jgi:hypothetical protein
MPVGLKLSPEVPHAYAGIFTSKCIQDAVMKISRENVLNVVRLT